MSVPDSLLIDYIFQPIINRTRQTTPHQLASRFSETAALVVLAAGLHVSIIAQALTPGIIGGGVAFALWKFFAFALDHIRQRQTPWHNAALTALLPLRITAMAVIPFEVIRWVISNEILYAYCIIFNVLLLCFAYFASCSPALEARMTKRPRRPLLPPASIDERSAQDRIDRASPEAFRLALDCLFDRSLERALHRRARRERESDADADLS